MKRCKCENGHFYDGDKYAQCPHCGNAEKAQTLKRAEKEKGAVSSFFSRKNKPQPKERIWNPTENVQIIRPNSSKTECLAQKTSKPEEISAGGFDLAAIELSGRENDISHPVSKEIGVTEIMLPETQSNAPQRVPEEIGVTEIMLPETQSNAPQRVPEEIGVTEIMLPETQSNAPQRVPEEIGVTEIMLPETQFDAPQRVPEEIGVTEIMLPETQFNAPQRVPEEIGVTEIMLPEMQSNAPQRVPEEIGVTAIMLPNDLRTVDPVSDILSKEASENHQSLKEAVSATGSTSVQSDDRTIQHLRKPETTGYVVGWLVAISGQYTGKSFEIKNGRNRIGRSLNMDISLTLEQGITRGAHAVLVYDSMQSIFLLQSGDGNGLTYKNGELVVAYTQLKSFDRIRLGQVEFVFISLCGDQFRWQ